MFGGERVFLILLSEWWQTVGGRAKESTSEGETGGENEGLLKAGRLKR